MEASGAFAYLPAQARALLTPNNPNNTNAQNPMIHVNPLPHVRWRIVPRRALVTLSTLIAGLSTLSAQTAPEAPKPSQSTNQPASQEEEIVILSPFVIDGSAEQGWVSNQSLGGTRMKADIKDLASSIEVLTMDFMDDLNLTSPEDAAIYSLNVENSSEYVSGNGLSQQSDITGGLRVRGLAKGTNSREFFEVRTPSDNYNLDRIDIASGPNAILFGTGSPAGAINGSLSRPNLARNKTVLRTQFDTFGGNRYDIDFNRVLSKNKLGIRLAAVRNNREWEESPSYELSKRYYGALSFRPFKKTTITAMFEKTDIDSHRPNAAYPADRITPWFEASTYPTTNRTPLNYPINQYVFPNSQEWITGRDLNLDGRVDGHWYQRPDGSIFAEPIPTSGAFPARSFISTGTTTAPTASQLFQVVGNSQRITTNGFTGSQISSYQNSVEPIRARNVNLDPVNAPSDDYTLADSKYFPVDANTFANINYTQAKSEITNLFFNQTLTNNWFFEFALQRERYRETGYQGGSFLEATMINVDPNMYLSDGVTLNPHAGDLYFDGSPQYNRLRYEAIDWRASTSYEFDFAKRTSGIWRHFGKHRAALLHSFRETKSRNQEFQYKLAPKVNALNQYYDARIPNYVFPTTTATSGIFIPTFNAVGTNNWLSNNRNLRSRYYYDVASGDVIPDTPFEMGQPWTFTDAIGEQWVVNPEHFLTASDGSRLVGGRSGPKYNGRRTHVDQFAYQGFFWKDRIVATFGYREDRINKIDERAPGTIPGYTLVNAQSGVPFTTAQLGGVFRHFDDIVPQAYDETKEISAVTKTAGIVVHPFKDWLDLPFGATISLGYNKSDTFQPDQDELAVNGANLEGNKGEGTDKSIRLGLFDEKFSVRYNQFENTAAPNSALLPFRRFRFAFQGLLNAMRDGLAPNLWVTDPLWPSKLYEGSVIASAFPAGASSNFADPYAIQSDTYSTGDEISLNWKVTKNWDLRFTYAKQEVIESNIAKDWIQFGRDMLVYMDTKRFPENFSGAPNGGDMNNDGNNTGTFTWAEIPTYQNNDWNKGYSIAGKAWGTTNGVNNFTGLSIKQRFEQEMFFSGDAPIPILEAFDGRPNEFVRQNRWNINTVYRFDQGVLKGLQFTGGFRYREAPVIGFEAKFLPGVTNPVPNLEKTAAGKAEKFIDIGVSYKGKSSWIGDRPYRINATCFNLLDDNTIIPSKVAVDGRPLTLNQQDGRKVTLSLEIEL